MSDDTRTAILDAAQSLVQSRGANGMSYEDISQLVGIRKASIHYHFARKSDLLSALIERYSAKFLGQLDDVLASGSTGFEMIQTVVDLFEAPLQDPNEQAVCLCGILATELPTLDADPAAHIRVFYRETNERLAEILKQGRSDETLEFTGEPARAAVAVFSLLEGALVTARVEGGVAGFRAIAQQLYRLLGAEA